MHISKIYTYPIKSFRPDELQSAEVTRHGFRYDRRFMVLKVLNSEDGQKYENMHVTTYTEMVLFFTKLNLPSDMTEGTILVTHRPPEGDATSIEIPLEPDTSSLTEVEVIMHRSPTKAYCMDKRYNDWLSARFGFDVILAYLGSNYRKVLMSTSHNIGATPGKSWFSSVSGIANALTGSTTVEEQKKQITFADCAPYLVVSERSMDDVHNRLPDGLLMDITKFRPNVIIAGAQDAWEEDYWGEIKINDSVVIECIHNCNRCKSINIDYETGKPGLSPAGKMLAKLQSDRRVDPGAKYSPIFGRYSFLGGNSEGQTIKVGDEVVVSKRNDSRTTFGKCAMLIHRYG